MHNSIIYSFDFRPALRYGVDHDERPSSTGASRWGRDEPSFAGKVHSLHRCLLDLSGNHSPLATCHSSSFKSQI